MRIPCCSRSFMQQLLGYNATTCRAGADRWRRRAGRHDADCRHCHRQDFGAHAGGDRLHHVCLHLPLSRRNVTTLRDDLCAGLVAARRADAAAAVLLHLHHQCGVCGHAQGGEQPGRRPDQLCAQHRRQHPDRAHRCAGDQPRDVAPAAPAKRHGAGLASPISSI